MNSRVLPIVKGVLTLDGSTVEKFFKPSADVIIDEIQRLLSRQTYDLLILTGGFGASPYLQYSLEMRLIPKIRLAIANSSGSGAVAVGGLIHSVQSPCKITDHGPVRPWALTELRTWRNFGKIPGSTVTYENNLKCDACDVGNVSGPEVGSEPRIDAPGPPLCMDVNGAVGTLAKHRYNP